MNTQELRELTRSELEQRLNELKEERFNLNMRRSVKPLDNPLRLRTIRREVARIQTFLGEDQRGTRKLAQARTSILDQSETGKKKKKSEQE